MGKGKCCGGRPKPPVKRHKWTVDLRQTGRNERFWGTCHRDLDDLSEHVSDVVYDFDASTGKVRFGVTDYLSRTERGKCMCGSTPVIGGLEIEECYKTEPHPEQNVEGFQRTIFWLDADVTVKTSVDLGGRCK